MEFGANKNTVSKAYQSLARQGYIDPRAGRGTFVTRRPQAEVRDQARLEVAKIIERAFRQARLGGMAKKEFNLLVQEVVVRIDDRPRPRVAYVDCNSLETPVLGLELERSISYPVEPVLVSDLIAHPQQYLLDFDLLVVNLSHLVEVEDHLPSKRDDGSAEILALMTPPDSGSLLRVARLQAGTRVGVVCTTPSGMETITGLVRATNPAVTVTGALVANGDGLRAIVESSDVLLVTVAAEATVADFHPTQSVIPVSFRVDDREADRVGQWIAAHLRQGEGVRPIDESAFREGHVHETGGLLPSASA